MIKQKIWQKIDFVNLSEKTNLNNEYRVDKEGFDMGEPDKSEKRYIIHIAELWNRRNSVSCFAKNRDTV